MLLTVEIFLYLIKKRNKNKKVKKKNEEIFSKKINSLKKTEGVPLLNFEGAPRVPLLNFEGAPGVPLLNFRDVPGPTFKL